MDNETSLDMIPDSKVHGANMAPTWVLSAPDGPHVGHMNLAIRDGKATTLFVVSRRYVMHTTKPPWRFYQNILTWLL